MKILKKCRKYLTLSRWSEHIAYENTSVEFYLLTLLLVLKRACRRIFQFVDPIIIWRAWRLILRMNSWKLYKRIQWVINWFCTFRNRFFIECYWNQLLIFRPDFQVRISSGSARKKAEQYNLSIKCSSFISSIVQSAINNKTLYWSPVVCQRIFQPNGEINLVSSHSLETS